MRQFPKQILAFLLVMVMIVGMMPAVGAAEAADQLTIINATAKSSMENYGWYLRQAYDGNYSAGYATGNDTMNNESVEDDHIQVELASAATVGSVKLYPSVSGGKVESFPKDFTIQVSPDGVEYTTVVTKTAYVPEGTGAQEFVFDAQENVRFVKIAVTKRSTNAGGKLYYNQFMEIEVFSADVPEEDPSVLRTIRTATASSSIENYGWYLHQAYDRNYSVGWATAISENGMESVANDFLQVELAQAAIVDSVKLFPTINGGKVVSFPKDFTIQVSADGVKYTTVVTETDYAPVGTGAQVFEFEAQEDVSFVKLAVTKRSTNESGTLYYNQIMEFEVYGKDMPVEEPEPEEEISNGSGISVGSEPALPSDPARTTVIDLKVNNLTEPLGVDTNPVFKWLPVMEGYAKAQSAYQIVVASTAELAQAGTGDIWDSGKVAGSDNFDVKYAGETALVSRTPYYWAVQVWDEDGVSIGWSNVAKFETGVLNASEWTAKWITAFMTLDGSNWIWQRSGAAFSAVPAGTQYFRGNIQLAEGKKVAKAAIVFSADDNGTVYVNGKAAATQAAATNAWQRGGSADISALMTSGTNVVAAQINNTTQGYAGFVAKITVRYTDGTMETFVTDNSWKVSAAAADGWQNLGFDDSTWNAPDQAVAYGQDPWKTNVNLQASCPETLSAPMLRKTFEIPEGKEVTRARAYVTGVGLFEMKINGQLPDDTVLNPAHTQYEDTVNYRVFNVTELLQQGTNAIAAEVGDGFYNCIVHTWKWNTAPYRDYPKFLMELVVEYSDGTVDKIVTDETWKAWYMGPTVKNDIYYGDDYDARLEVNGWTKAGFKDSAWDNAVLEDAPTGKLTFENMEPMRRLWESEIESITQLDNDTWIVKVPQMMTGWARITFRDMVPGTQIKVAYAETVNSKGYLNAGGYDGIYQTAIYTCKGGEETYEPKFTYGGFHYFQIDGYTGTLTEEDIACYMVANDVERIGSVETSNEMINELHDMMVRTMLNNMQGKPTDTPWIEKNGWTGDFNVSQRTFTYNYDTSAFTNKFQGDMRDSAYADGVIPVISPTAGWDWGTHNNAVWNTVYINSLYEGWKFGGQFAQIEEHYDAMRAQTLAYIADSRDKYGWTWAGNQLGDWITPEYRGTPIEGSAITGSGYVYLALERMAEIADVMGKTEDAAEYRAAMAEIYKAFNETFYKADKGFYETNKGTAAGMRQTSQLMPLHVGLVPEEYRDTVVRSLVNHIVNVKDTHLDTGCVGTSLILPVLMEEGYADLAMDLMLQDTFPSWGFMYKSGSDSMWEHWSSPRSRDHYFLGTFDEWLYAYLGGIRDMENGYETVTIDPYINDNLTYANVSVDTVRGLIQSNWTLSEDTVTMDVVIPAGSTASIYLPATSVEEVTVNGAALTAQEGISAAVVEDGKVKVTAASGAYKFVMNADDLPVDKSQLREKIYEARKMDEINYPTSVWEAFPVALENAEAALYNTEATQEQVDAAVNALAVAIDATEAFRMGNVAYGKKATASSSIENYGWFASKLTDGTTNAASATAQVQGWASNNDLENSHAEWAMVDLGRTYNVARVDLYPAGQTNAVGEVCDAFPVDFTIEISLDGDKWTTVCTAGDYPSPVVVTAGVSPVQSFEFAAQDARYVRVSCSELKPLNKTDGGRYRMELSEIEVYSSVADSVSLKKLIQTAETLDAGIHVAEDWNTLQTAITEAKAVVADETSSEEAVAAAEATLAAAMEVFTGSNLALNKSVEVSSTWESATYNWLAANLTDGDTKEPNNLGQYAGWTSADSTGAQHEEWVVIDLGETMPVNQLQVAPGGHTPGKGTEINGFPKGFVIEVSDDKENWKPVYTETDYPTFTMESDTENAVQAFDFETVNGRYIRFRATELRTPDGYRMQLAEIQAFNYPVMSAKTVNALIAAIGEVTLDSKAAIEAARAAYDKLNPVQAELADLAALEAAEAQYAYLEQGGADKDAAAAVDALIDAIDTEKGETIEAARTAYDALTEEAKELVTKYGELEAAELYWNTVNNEVSLVLSGADEINAFDETVIYTLSGKDMNNLATMILSFEITDEYLTDPVVEVAEGWMIFAQTWKNGVLNVAIGNNTGANGDDDILTITLKPNEVAGNASVAITFADLSAYLGEGETFVKVNLDGASITTEVKHNVYDVNKDGVVDQLDMTRCQRYYGTDFADADVNSDGDVNIDDLILILNNFHDKFA